MLIDFGAETIEAKLLLKLFAMKRLITVLFVASCFFSCEKPPQDDPVDNPVNTSIDITKLLGAWVETYDDYGYAAKEEGIPRYTFHDNYSWEYYTSDVIWLFHSITYQYEIEDNVITLISDDDPSDDRYEITRLDENEMEWQRVGTEFSTAGLSTDYKHFSRSEGQTSDPGSGYVPDEELDIPVVEGEFTGYVYDYGYCNAPDFWYQFGDYQERIDMFQIPDEAMAKLTTEGLSRTCMYYPIRKDMGYFSCELEFINAHVGELYNGLKELSMRKHGPEALLKLYETLKLADPANSKEEGLMYDKDFSEPWTFMDRNYLEMLLASAYFTPKMTLNQIERLADAIRVKIEEITRRELNSYAYGYARPYCTLCRILLVKHERGIIELTDHELDILSGYMRTNGMPRTPAHWAIEVLTETFRLLELHFPELIVVKIEDITG